jgi:hypothetical protein
VGLSDARRRLFATAGTHRRRARPRSHLHGGFVAGDSDGNPAVTPGGFTLGQTQNVFYPNQAPQMPASLLWFHDHGLGTTRLNVFAGLAAGYILRDGNDTGTEPNPVGSPAGPTRSRWSSRTASSTPTGPSCTPGA